MATRRRRRFTADFKKRVALEALRGDRTVQEIAARHEVHPNQVSTWKRQAIDGLDEIFGGGRTSRQSEHEATVRDLHAKIGELTVERDFFCAGSNAEPGRTPGDGRPRRRVEHQPSVRVARHQPLVGVPTGVQEAGSRCSMDGRGRCLDNVFIERLWRSLKYEAVYLHELSDGFAAERVIAAWMTFYSHVRPHSALGGRTPAEAYGEERAA